MVSSEFTWEANWCKRKSRILLSALARATTLWYSWLLNAVLSKLVSYPLAPFGALSTLHLTRACIGHFFRCKNWHSLRSFYANFLHSKNANDAGVKMGLAFQTTWHRIYLNTGTAWLFHSIKSPIMFKFTWHNHT